MIFMTTETYNKCTSQIFKKDISELCDKCPLINVIQTGIDKQIILQALEQKELLTKQQFENYINSEVENAKGAMQRVSLTEQQNENDKSDQHRAKRIEIYIWNKERIKALNNLASVRTTKIKNKLPEKFEDLFCNPNHLEVCLDILKCLDPPVIDAKNNYIGKNKGIIPLWISVLKKHSPEPLIKHFPDSVYKDLLNNHINGLQLTEDASEFRKTYKRLQNNKTELDIKTILSLFSQEGKLGK